MNDIQQAKSELEEFREAKDYFFKTDRQSPLTREQRKDFQGLHYFPENPELRLEVTIDEFPDKQEIEIQTSTGDVQKYQRYGRFTFDVDGQEAQLTLFWDGGNFFLPFVDSLAGKETYGAGRYLEPEMLDDHRLLVDFNLAYNPYCAYNEAWSCPLTPFENRLKVPIRAGEKVFH
jgi:uncharacterized protein (DUF1684 family)